jgi:uncharacterized membrane protein YjgN (DUF898 family)
MYGITRCPKCGYTQKTAPACGSCGAAMNYSNPFGATPRSDSKPAPSRPEPAPAIAEDKAPVSGKPSESGTNSSGRLVFHGSGGSLFGIHIVNIFLTLLTLGVYYFWGKAKVRNYLFGQSEFAGDRFAYHGTGRELFTGFLKAAIIFGTISALFRAAPLFPGGIAVKIAAMLLAYALLFMFIPLAMVGTRRYRLSRSSWRGIRFSFRGKTNAFIKLFLRGTLLSLFTFGIYYPFFLTRQYAFMTDGAYFGNRKFAFDGEGKGIFPFYIRAMAIWALWIVLVAIAMPVTAIFIGKDGVQQFGSKQMAMPVIFGVIILASALVFFYLKSYLSAKQLSYFWNHTTIDTARFQSTIGFHPLFLLTLTNFFLLIVTLGFAWPWAAARKARFYMSNIRLEGAIDLQAVQQEAQPASPTGDALGGLLDVDIGFGPA